MITNLVMPQGTKQPAKYLYSIISYCKNFCQSKTTLDLELKSLNSHFKSGGLVFGIYFIIHINPQKRKGPCHSRSLNFGLGNNPS